MNIDPRGRHADFAASIDAFEDERAARQLLEDAVTIFQGRTANAPPDFVMQMFARTAPEDLVRYDASEIAEITAGTWRFLGERQQQTPKIQFATAQSALSRRLKSVAIVEILNDDMPFLVDSVMAELTEQGLDPH